jgi:signal transduction histidine kinase
MDEIAPIDRDDMFPIDRYPDPVISYTIKDGEPEVRAINEAFESMFDPIPPGMSVRRLVEQTDISLSDISCEFLDYLEGDDVVIEKVTTSNNGYCARILPPTEEFHGYIFLISDNFVDCATSTVSLRADQGRSQAETESLNSKETKRDQSDEFTIARVASVLSHDLRNPLDVAKARLRAARETGADEHFDHVETAHERMERIIEDVLTLSRGTEHIDPEDTVELNTVAESAWETVETGSATLTVQNELPATTADSDQVERLFENLFRNAVEHGNEPAVTIGSLDDAAAGFYVADNGPGIPSEQRSCIFEPGYSSHDHGTGLGLSIVKRIAESHGWTIEITNEDSGTRFEIRGVESKS